MKLLQGAYGEAGNGNEMEAEKEIGNENGNKNAPIPGAMLIMSDALVFYSAMVYPCTVLCDYIFSVID